MRNQVQDGKVVKLPVGSALTGGTYTQVGKLNAVLESDADSNNDAVCMLEGVFTLSVTAAGSVAIGDYVYTSDGSAVDDTNTGDIVGTALGAVSATTADIPVRLHN